MLFGYAPCPAAYYVVAILLMLDIDAAMMPCRHLMLLSMPLDADARCFHCYCYYFMLCPLRCLRICLFFMPLVFATLCHVAMLMLLFTPARYC